ncbi:MAG: prepilin peptidase [Candidatus Paceibacterota bacterium]
MSVLYLIIFFVFGTIVGSFLNVFALRYNTGLSYISGRSKCFSCGKGLLWYELVPILSFLVLKGKCYGCKSKISIQYPLIETITGFIFVMILWKVGFTMLLPFYLFLAGLLVVISIYDFKHKIIPDGMVFTFDMVALVLLFTRFGFLNTFSNHFLLDLLAGPILFAFFAFLWLISSGKWMGFGDAKLALGVGWLLGLSSGIMAIMLAFWIGAIVSILLIFLQKLNLSHLGLTIKSEVPFAPFIILGLFIEFFTGWGVLQISYLLNIF